MMRFGTIMMAAVDRAFFGCTERQECGEKTERPPVKSPSDTGSANKKKTDRVTGKV